MALRTALFGLLLARAVLADVVRVTSWAEFEAATRPLAFERDTAVSIELAANITLAPAPTPLAQRGIEVARGNNVTVRSAAGGPRFALAGGYADRRLFRVGDGGAVRIERVDLRGFETVISAFNAGPGEQAGLGGALYVGDGGALALRDVALASSTAMAGCHEGCYGPMAYTTSGSGGALAAQGARATVSLDNVTFRSNVATQGGYMTARGGALLVLDGAHVRMTQSVVFADNAINFNGEYTPNDIGNDVNGSTALECVGGPVPAIVDGDDCTVVD